MSVSVCCYFEQKNDETNHTFISAALKFCSKALRRDEIRG